MLNSYDIIIIGAFLFKGGNRMKRMILLVLMLLTLSLTNAYANDNISVDTSQYDERIELISPAFEYFDSLVYDYDNVDHDKWDAITSEFKGQITMTIYRRSDDYEVFSEETGINDVIDQKRLRTMDYGFDIIDSIDELEYTLNNLDKMNEMGISPSEDIANTVAGMKMKYAFLMTEKGLERDYIYLKLRTEY